MKVGSERIRTEMDRLSAALRVRKVLNGCRLCCYRAGSHCCPLNTVFAKCCSGGEMEEADTCMLGCDWSRGSGNEEFYCLLESGHVQQQDSTGCEDEHWMKLAQDRVQWRALVLAVLKLCILLPES